MCHLVKPQNENFENLEEIHNLNQLLVLIQQPVKCISRRRP